MEGKQLRSSSGLLDKRGTICGLHKPDAGNFGRGDAFNPIGRREIKQSSRPGLKALKVLEGSAVRLEERLDKDSFARLPAQRSTAEHSSMAHWIIDLEPVFAVKRLDQQLIVLLDTVKRDRRR